MASVVSVGVPVGVRPEGLCAILPKWFLPTRLETRTKESNIYASVLVEKPTREMKVIDAKRKQQHRPTMSLRVKV
jgi:hypothetical protein